MSPFDPTRAWLRGPDFFQRYVVRDAGVPVEQLDLKADVELIIAERQGQRAGFVMRELSHPHGAQGDLAGEPYLVSF